MWVALVYRLSKIYLIFVISKEKEREESYVMEVFHYADIVFGSRACIDYTGEINGTSLLNRPTRQYQLKLHSRTMSSSTRMHAREQNLSINIARVIAPFPSYFPMTPMMNFHAFPRYSYQRFGIRPVMRSHRALNQSHL